MTVRTFVGDVLRRVFRVDKAFAVTVWRALHAPGTLVNDYLAGRRAGFLDPIHYFASSVFVQFVVASLTRALAPLVDRPSAIQWLGRLGGVVAVKILIIFWMGTIWKLVFRPKKHNLAELYVFATYAFGTAGLLWALVPLIALALPIASSEPLVVEGTLAIELAYLTYSVREFGELSVWGSLLRCATVLSLGYGLLLGLVGVPQWVRLLLPPLP